MSWLMLKACPKPSRESSMKQPINAAWNTPWPKEVPQAGIDVWQRAALGGFIHRRFALGFELVDRDLWQVHLGDGGLSLCCWGCLFSGRPAAGLVRAVS